MRYVVIFALVIFAFAGAYPVFTRSETVLCRVDAALESAEMTPDEAVFHLYNSLHNPSAVPSALRDGTVDLPSGTPVMDRISRLLEECSAPIEEEILTLLSRPNVGSPTYHYDSALGYFKIHWTDTGSNATNLAWVQMIAEAMDHSWTHMCGVMNWDEPPSDLGLGGDDKLDVYMLNLGGGVLGWCSSAGNPPDPTTPEADFASHIGMSTNEGWGEILMREVAAHEFKHAIQNGYEAAEPTWFKENCATWMQNETYDTNRYADYMKSGENCLRRPWFDIRSGAMYWYGATPWPMYMQLRAGGQETVRRVWEEAADVIGPDMLDAIDRAAQHYGMTFLQWLGEYSAWRWFTGNRACGAYYLLEESSLWIPGAFVMPFHNFTSLPASGDEGVYPPETFGLAWIRVCVENYPGWVEFSFDGRDHFDWHVGVIQTNAAGNSAFQFYTVTDAPSEFTLGASTTGWDELIFYVQPITITSLTMNYDFTITHVTGIDEQEGPAGGLTLSPASNPMTAGEVITLNLPEAGFTTLNVYDVSGRMVQTIIAEQLPQGENALVWDAASLSAGTYFLRLTATGGGVTRKVMLSN